MKKYFYLIGCVLCGLIILPPFGIMLSVMFTCIIFYHLVEDVYKKLIGKK